MEQKLKLLRHCLTDLAQEMSIYLKMSPTDNERQQMRRSRLHLIDVQRIFLEAPSFNSIIFCTSNACKKK